MIGPKRSKQPAAVKAVKGVTDRHMAKLVTELAKLRGEGFTTPPRIAQALNNRHVLTVHGGRWNPALVVALLTRIAAKPAEK